MTNSYWQVLLHTASEHANFGRNEPFLELCEEIVKNYGDDPQVLAKTSSLLTQYGFISDAKKYLQNALKISPNNKKFLLNLAHVELLLRNKDRFNEISSILLTIYPNCLDTLSNLIHLFEYSDEISDEKRLALAKQWGAAAIDAAGGPKGRPPFRNIKNLPLRIGYISADFCQHTVGILIKEVLAKHDREKFVVYAYSAGFVRDWITDEIKKYCQFIDVTSLRDHELANRITADQIDILVDLSGHTGGTRLSVCAYRPAPVMVSMLGYYATTGLEYIDASFLDPWHITNTTKNQFVEPIVLLEPIRWCFYPAFPTPLISQPPCTQRGSITFGSFNNTLKYNITVFEVWSKILHAVPQSRLILKWRTFNDPEFKNKTIASFADLGIDASRIELRGPSFHMQMLEEYSDIDIALDPFPFSGGATSCEALYMGIPVVTLPQERVVSRQTYAFLLSIGLHELIAKDQRDYINIAIQLAMDQKRLLEYRDNLRLQMLHSLLMNIKDFTSSLEFFLLKIYNQISNK